MKQQIVYLKEFAVDVGEKPKETINYAQAVKLFKGIMLRIWGSGVTAHKLNDKTTFYFEDPKAKTLACVTYRSTPLPKAMGNTLLRSSPYYKVYISPRLLLEPKEIIDRCLTHEVIHIGYPHHDRHFEYMCKKHGTFSSENAMRGGKVKIQEKRGSRYVDTGKTFDTMEDAMKWGREEIRKAKNINDERKRGGLPKLPPKKLRMIG